MTYQFKPWEKPTHAKPTPGSVTREVGADELRLAQRLGWPAHRAGGDYLFACKLPDGRTLHLLEWRVGGVQVSVGWANGFYDDTWIYDVEQADDGWRAALGWNGVGDPDGWYQHPQSGRRRPDGLIENEYINASER